VTDLGDLGFFLRIAKRSQPGFLLDVPKSYSQTSPCSSRARISLAMGPRLCPALWTAELIAIWTNLAASTFIDSCCSAIVFPSPSSLVIFSMKKCRKFYK
jgi:hypothetical protein